MSEPTTDDREALRVLVTNLITFVESQPAWQPFTIEQTGQLRQWKATLTEMSLLGAWGQFCGRVLTLVNMLDAAQCVAHLALERAQELRHKLTSLMKESS